MSAAHLRILGYVATITVHSANILHMAVTLERASKDPQIKEFGTLQFCFLTCWTFLFQIAYSCLGLYCDYASLANKTSGLHRNLLSVRETLFTAILWPTSVLVFTLFWPIYIYDEGLVFPPFIDQLLSYTNNQIMHTFIIPVVLWELCLLPRHKHTHGFDVLCLTAYMLSYLYVLFNTYATKKVWVYPILKMTLGTIYFPLIFIAIAIILSIAYYVQWPLYKSIRKSTSNTCVMNGAQGCVKKTK